MDGWMDGKQSGKLNFRVSIGVRDRKAFRVGIVPSINAMLFLIS